jgi:hypothetical protein
MESMWCVVVDLTNVSGLRRNNVEREHNHCIMGQLFYLQLSRAEDKTRREKNPLL